jgi:hypothetical protein
VKRTTEEIRYLPATVSTVRFTDWNPFAFIPAVNCWATIIRPLGGLTEPFLATAEDVTRIRYKSWLLLFLQLQLVEFPRRLQRSQHPVRPAGSIG